MLDAVSRAFAEHVRINWDLRIRSNAREPLSLQYLLSLVDPEIPLHLVGEKAEELGDVLRKLFCDAEQVTLEQRLWHRNARAAALAAVFLPGDVQRRVVVECGVAAAMADEGVRFETFVHDQPTQGLSPASTAETMHFAGRAYTATTGNLEGLRAFRDHYGKQSVKEIGAALEKLFTVSLAASHADARLAQTSESIAELYRAKLGLEVSTLAEEIKRRIEFLYRQARALGLGGLESGPDGLRILFPKAASGTLAHPVTCMCNDALTGASVSVKVGATIGALDVDTVLIDGAGNAWPSDFGSLGPGPLLGDYAALETSVKFDLLEARDLTELYALEQCSRRPHGLTSASSPSPYLRISPRRSS